MGENYLHDQASLKLHLNLNDIGLLDEETVLGLVKLLHDEAENPDTNMNFFYKIIDPTKHDHKRFKDTDQLTIYFDKYSSTADVIRLSKKIEDYLLEKGVPKNKTSLGPKDSFGFNSFVSARFDNNKLLGEYDLYSFFDLELGKFFAAHSEANELETLPLSAFEAVFNTVISSPEKFPLIKNQKGVYLLSEESSNKVQAEFKKLLSNPKEYIGAVESEDSKVLMELLQKQNRNRYKINELKAQINKLKVGPIDSNSEFGIRYRLYTLDMQLSSYYKETLRLIDGLPSTDNNLHTEILVLVEEKKAEFNEHIQLQRTHYPIEEAEDKKFKAKHLYTDLCLEYNKFRLGKIPYDEFQSNCKNFIALAKPSLEKHRGWKEIILNVLACIASIGIVPYLEYKKSKGEHYFFKVNTDSINTVEKAEQAINKLDPGSV